MSKKILVGMVSILIGLAVLLVSCSGAGASGERIRAAELKAKVEGSTVTVPLSSIKSNRNSRFKVGTPVGELSFMAYDFGGTSYIRADICPPCRSESFSLVGDKLVCDACGTVFAAKDGSGVSGACVNYPKESVVFTANSDLATLKTDDLVNAYKETLKPGR